MPRDEISLQNRAFWDELCGTSLAKAIGVTDDSKSSLEKFDEWYFRFYPYLEDYIQFDRLKGRKVLEVGLGYGSVAQRLAEAGVDYTGLDIAAGPVSMANLRLQRLGLNATAKQGDILAPDLEPDSFDAIVAIGCLHHTGDLGAAIENCRMLLKPGGELIFMVYYAYSYRRWWISPRATMRYLAREAFGYRGVVERQDARQRAAYDSNAAGDAAPHTDWISKRSLRTYCGRFRNVRSRTENIDQEPPFRRFTRDQLLRTPIPHRVGLDLYARASK